MAYLLELCRRLGAANRTNFEFTEVEGASNVPETGQTDLFAIYSIIVSSRLK